eukprot:TRINITY_DN14936_c0_g1_i1.p1 TRINITY_DN14936_c0_g1~~TRINITY_DN14936_c0_g1_i1.p1  ORF type:complete len:222 (-),score=41.64 TRINITY_DN14936_c0_g1_i1:556-1173(-)
MACAISSVADAFVKLSVSPSARLQEGRDVRVRCGMASVRADRKIQSLSSCVSRKGLPSTSFAGQSLQISVQGTNVVRRPSVFVIQARAAKVVTKKPDQAQKRARQAEKRRLRNKAKKSEMSTRIKKVLVAIEELKKRPTAVPEDIVPVEGLIAEAYSVIDKAVKCGTIHQNKGARRKSRLARAKRAAAIQFGWYSPAEAPAPAAV